MEADIDKKRRLAQLIVAQASSEQREPLMLWAAEMKSLTASNLPTLEKAKRAVAVTRDAKIIGPIIAIIAKEVKVHGWDKRSSTQRLGLGAAGLSLAVFGGSTAGIAALGGAVAVPLWAVFGGGAMLVKYLYDELSSAQVKDAEEDYPTIDIKTDDDLNQS